MKLTILLCIVLSAAVVVCEPVSERQVLELLNSVYETKNSGAGLGLSTHRDPYASPAGDTETCSQVPPRGCPFSSAVLKRAAFSRPAEADMKTQHVARTMQRVGELAKQMYGLSAAEVAELPITDAVLRDAADPIVRSCAARTIHCDKHAYYRTQDGTCNNINDEYATWGAGASKFQRLIHVPSYDDGIGTPRSKDVAGNPLPSARNISLQVFTNRNATNPTLPHMIMQLGQFLDHDITFTPMATDQSGNVLGCTGCDDGEDNPECLPITIPVGDPVFGSGICMPFTRSLNAQFQPGQMREQQSSITAFIDASNVYGSDESRAASLRTFRDGKLKLQENGLMLADLDNPACRASTVHGTKVHCFRGGDVRASEQLALTSIQHLWAIMHNRIVKLMQGQNPHWSDERLYQEGRKLVGMIHQHIDFSYLIPHFIGPEMTEKYDLKVLDAGFYHGYDPTLNPTIFNEFAAAGYRFGHTLIDNYLQLGLNRENVMETYGTHFTPDMIYMDPKYNFRKLLLGLTSQRLQLFDRNFADALHNHLFGKGKSSDGFDLMALNIQRGRDHGVQPYIKFRDLFDLSVPKSFDDLLEFMTNESVQALQKVYASVEDIDLFAGMVNEIPLKGAVVGPTVANIIATQFMHLKKGDRFYYENHVKSFYNEVTLLKQLNQVRKIDIYKVICMFMMEDVDELKEISADIHELCSNAHPGLEDREEMKLHRLIDMSLWKDTDCNVNHEPLQPNIVTVTVPARCG